MEVPLIPRTQQVKERELEARRLMGLVVNHVKDERTRKLCTRRTQSPPPPYDHSLPPPLSPTIYAQSLPPTCKKRSRTQTVPQPQAPSTIQQPAAPSTTIQPTIQQPPAPTILPSTPVPPQKQPRKKVHQDTTLVNVVQAIGHVLDDAYFAPKVWDIVAQRTNTSATVPATADNTRIPSVLRSVLHLLKGIFGCNFFEKPYFLDEHLAAETRIPAAVTIIQMLLDT